MVRIEDVARLAHEANRVYCQLIGDNSQPLWEDAPDWQKESFIAGVMFHLANPGAKPEDGHNSWLRKKEGEGWVYGDAKDPEKKTHPCMVPYGALPLDQRVKDSLFIGVVHAMSPIVAI